MTEIGLHERVTFFSGKIWDFSVSVVSFGTLRKTGERERRKIIIICKFALVFFPNDFYYHSKNIFTLIFSFYAVITFAKEKSSDGEHAQ